MAGKADFSEDEWKELQQGVTGAGMLVSTAHRDFTDSFGEAKAVAKQLQAHRASDSELVRDLSGTHGTGFGLTAGQRARLVDARALLSDAHPILHHEPTAHHDTDAANAVHDAIARLAEWRPVLVVTHRPELVALANRHLDLGAMVPR